ncbi:MAG TPA: helix-turn-helix transcriptional regulator [Ramlibacter sp.]|jgi:transcriptional regulator with XRE-family HTH domain|nr:helix-turn-helix transcriptional regulator [Ramlibacter sp.]
MPSAAPAVDSPQRELLARLGQQLRAERERQKVSAVAAAEAAGLSRPTVHRIERGEPSVAMGAWIALANTLGVSLGVIGIGPGASTAIALPERVQLDDFPQLRKLAWQLPGVPDVSAREAFDLYERNWRHVDAASLSAAELSLIRALSLAFGGGRLLV